ncbi:MAG: hypothetical protein OXG58_01850 [Gemmatimonadetes bacterium]|nr:hypothetical protein [Gemmatimonadota bacterium]MCY3942220.1 hypothetical protein [Gemmatimonadota bacterium]
MLTKPLRKGGTHEETAILSRPTRRRAWSSRVGACFTVHRESRLVEHSVETMVVHRIAGTGLALATRWTIR